MMAINDMKLLYHDKNPPAPHCVMEMLMTDWKRMVPYSIDFFGYKLATVNKK